MSEEPAPTVWELQRGQADIRARLDRAVPADLFAAQLAAQALRIAEVERDVAALAAADRERVKEERERAKDTAREQATNRRLVAGAVLAAVLQFVVQLWSAGQGAGR